MSDSDPDPDPDPDPEDLFGRAVRDRARGGDAPLVARDGPETREHPIEAFYLTPRDPASDRTAWLDARIRGRGPLVDLGAGAGRDALYYQEDVETVALEASPALVETMRERGVADAREGDMFALRETFPRDRFGTALVYGTQACLAGSMDGLRRFLVDLAAVTTDAGGAAIDGYDPTRPAATDLLGYRADPSPGLAHRVLQFESGDEAAPIRQFRLFSPARLREAAAPTPWTVRDVDRDDSGAHYVAWLAKPTRPAVDASAPATRGGEVDRDADASRDVDVDVDVNRDADGSGE